MELKLPPKIVSRGDLNRIIRELNKLGDFLVGAQFTDEDRDTVNQNISPLLADLAAMNNCDLLDQSVRKELYDKLNLLADKAPGLHISFTAEPSPKSLERLILWLRENIHHQLLLSVGLQPTIAAGCVLRTPNRVLDMGLRQTLLKQQPLLLEMIKGVNHE